MLKGAVKRLRWIIRRRAERGPWRYRIAGREPNLFSLQPPCLVIVFPASVGDIGGVYHSASAVIEEGRARRRARGIVAAPESSTPHQKASRRTRELVAAPESSSPHQKARHRTRGCCRTRELLVARELVAEAGDAKLLRGTADRGWANRAGNGYAFVSSDRSSRVGDKKLQRSAE